MHSKKMVILNTARSANKRSFRKEVGTKLNNQHIFICFVTVLMDIFNRYIFSFLGPSRLGQIGNFSSEIGKKTYVLALGLGPNFGPKFR